MYERGLDIYVTFRLIPFVLSVNKMKMGTTKFGKLVDSLFEMIVIPDK